MRHLSSLDKFEKRCNLSSLYICGILLMFIATSVRENLNVQAGGRKRCVAIRQTKAIFGNFAGKMVSRVNSLGWNNVYTVLFVILLRSVSLTTEVTVKVQPVIGSGRVSSTAPCSERGGVPVAHVDISCESLSPRPRR